MIDSIALAGLKRSDRFGYAAELPFFKGRKTVQFRPGLNILFGGNGTGKSTITRILGDSLCATQGGVSVVTHEAIDAILADTGFGGSAKDGIVVKVKHDGQPLIYMDPRTAVGLRNGRMDDDFMRQGLQEIFDRKTLSQGQNALRRGWYAMNVIAGKSEPPKSIEYRVHSKCLSDFWKKRLAIAQTRMEGTIDKGQPTLVLDEPENGFSFEWQAQLWSNLTDERVTSRLQVIVATHSPFALGHAMGNYIEMQPDALKQASATFVELGQRLAAR